MTLCLHVAALDQDSRSHGSRPRTPTSELETRAGQLQFEHTSCRALMSSARVPRGNTSHSQSARKVNAYFELPIQLNLLIGKLPSADLRRPDGQTGRAFMKTSLISFAEDVSGATAIEYGLIAAIVGVGIIVGLTQLQSGLNTLFGNVNTQLTK